MRSSAGTTGNAITPMQCWGNRRAVRDLLALRERNGLDNRISLRRADVDVANAEQEFAAIDESVGLRRNQLAALVGSGPDRGRSITRPPLSPSTPAGVPAGVTTDLLGRRPDIVAARERVEAAASRIKVARAGFFRQSASGRSLAYRQSALAISSIQDRSLEQPVRRSAFRFFKEGHSRRNMAGRMPNMQKRWPAITRWLFPPISR